MGAVVVWFGCWNKRMYYIPVARKLEIDDIAVLININRNLKKWLNNDMDYIN